MTRRTSVALALAASLMLTACSAEDWDSTHESNLHPRTVTVDDREVTCVLYKAGYAGGLSCDWEATE